MSFADGSKQISTSIHNGMTALPVLASNAAFGPYTLAWMLKPVGGPETPQEWVQQKAIDCRAAAEDSDNSNNQDDLKAEDALDDAKANEKGFWDDKGQPSEKKKLKELAKFLNEEIVRLRKMHKKEGDADAKRKISDAIESALKAGKAAGLKLGGK